MARKNFLLTILFCLAACQAPIQTAAPIPTSIPISPTLTPQATVTLRPTDQPTIVRPTRAPSPTSAKPAIQTPAWFNDTVLYEIFPRSFYDTNGDGIGDLKGITQQLDYLQELGVGALWLTPIFESPSYHGYDTTDYYKINPEFGTEQDLIDLVNAAHARDIKIILDFVAGHSSDEHPFFKDAYGNPASKYADWYRWLDDAHTKYEHFGSATNMPKWNQDNPATRAYLIENAKYWMQKANVDGYRLDYALGVSHDFWKAFRQEIKALNPDALLLGEVWTSGLKIAPYYDNEFDATFDFPVYFDVMGSHDRAGNSALLGKRAPDAYESSLKAQTRLYPPGARSVRFFNNHDTLRVMSQVAVACPQANDTCAAQNLERAKLAAIWLMTLPATPMIYYGEEIGMAGDKSDGDRTLREPMDWYTNETGAGMTTWYNPANGFNKPADGISVQEQTGKPNSLLELYRTLGALRAKHDALRHGEFVPLQVQGADKVMAYARAGQDEAIVVVLNVSDQPADITLDLSPFASGQANLSDLLSKSDVSFAPAQNYPLRVAPLSGSVFKLSSQ